MIRVITIEREYGSGAAEIARELAGRLNWKLWDQEITAEIARRLKCPFASVQSREERPDPAFYRLVRIFMRGSYESSMEGSGVELLDAEHLAKLFEKVITNLADQGNCVIVGRGGSWFLRDRPDTLRTFIFASREEKIRRVIASQHKARSEAEHLVDTVDHERATFVKRYYDHNWPERTLYHSMLNADVGDEMVLKMILTQMDLLSQQASALDKPA